MAMARIRCWHAGAGVPILGTKQREGRCVAIAGLAEGLTRGIEGFGERVSGALFEPVIRLGVTGLARAGKTVFITSLVANLLDRGRMGGLAAAGRMVCHLLRFAAPRLSGVRGWLRARPGLRDGLIEPVLAFR